MIGREGVINYFNEIKSAFPDIRFYIEDQVAEGDKVVTHWMAEGTHRGIFEGIPPSGKRLRITSIDIDYIINGRFSQCYANMDQFGLLQQLGVLSNDVGKDDEVAPQAWDNIAEGYDKYVMDTEVWLANEALKRVGLKHGQKFLDVAAGCGGLSLPAARLGAEVLAVDWSLAMIKQFENRIRRENLKTFFKTVLPEIKNLKEYYPRYALALLIYRIFGYGALVFPWSTRHYNYKRQQRDLRPADS